MSHPNDAQSKLTQKVFQIVATRFAAKAKDIDWMSQTGNSFEEWCGWEAWLACSEVADWNVWAKPQYSKWGVDCNDAGDWLVEDQRNNRVFVELGLIHDGTGAEKWRLKCDNDREKLLRLRNNVAGIVGLHLLLITSKKSSDILNDSAWLARWSIMDCWSFPTELHFSAALPEGGQFALRGWLVSGETEE